MAMSSEKSTARKELQGCPKIALLLDIYQCCCTLRRVEITAVGDQPEIRSQSCDASPAGLLGGLAALLGLGVLRGRQKEQLVQHAMLPEMATSVLSWLPRLVQGAKVPATGKFHVNFPTSKRPST